MVGVAQLVEHRIVAPEVAGSIPVAHPTFQLYVLWSRESAYNQTCSGRGIQFPVFLTENKSHGAISSIGRAADS